MNPFSFYLHHVIKIRRDPVCRYCNTTENSVKHALPESQFTEVEQEEVRKTLGPLNAGRLAEALTADQREEQDVVIRFLRTVM